MNSSVQNENQPGLGKFSSKKIESSPTSVASGHGVIYQICLYALLFPYINPIGLPFDVQPYVFAATLGLLFYKYRLNTAAIVALYSLSIGFSINLSIVGWSSRNTITFLNGLVAVTLGFIVVIDRQLLRRGLQFALNIYLIFSFIQVLAPGVVAIFIPRTVATQADRVRGLTSLTPEPGYLGTLGAVFFLFFLTDSVSLNRTANCLKSIVLTVLCAQAATGVLLIGIVTVLMIIAQRGRHRWRTLIAGFLALLLGYVAWRIYPQSRMFVLLRGTDSLLDGSASQRSDGIFDPFIRLKDHPFGTTREIKQTGLSGLGGVVETLGIFSIPFITGILFKRQMSLVGRASQVFICIVMLTAISVATPLPWLLLGAAFSRRTDDTE